MPQRLRRLTPKRVIVEDLGLQGRKVTLRCRCLSVSLVQCHWSPLAEAVEDLRAAHCRLTGARCMHGAPLGVVTKAPRRR